MPTETKPEVAKRPWWKRKTEIGVGLMIFGGILSLIPYTAPISGIVIKAGEILTGVGVIHRNLKGQTQ